MKNERLGRPSLLATMVVGLFAASSPTQAQAAFTWAAPNHRPISGEPGSTNESGTTDPGFALRSIAWGESNDNPRFVRAEARKLCHGSCTGGTRHLSYLSLANHPEWANQLDKTVSVGAGRYITAIQVCMSPHSNRSDRKVKGIRLWGATISPNGDVQRQPEVREQRRFRCRANGWSERRSCMGNRVAVGLLVHRNGSRGMTGVALQCARVESL